VSGRSILGRSPYLQRITTSGAHVMFTASAPAEVRLSQPPAAFDLVASSTNEPLVRGLATYRTAAGELQPDTLYCYELMDDGAAVARPAGFRTAPAPDSGAKVSFVALGDSGSGSSDQIAVAKQLATVPFRLMLHTGDIAYESGTLAEFEANFFGVYGSLLRSFPVFPAIGNHDDATTFRLVYDLPFAGPANWYSFDYGDVHFVALDTNHMSTEQAAWLDADLASTDRKWRIVFGHHPPYSSGEHGSALAFRDLFGPILAEHRVALVLSGHDHHYERSRPQDGVYYVVTGGGGRGTRPTGVSEFTAFAEQVLHFVYVEIQGDELALHAIDATGAEFDQLVIRARE
jgi:hypothetical protein